MIVRRIRSSRWAVGAPVRPREAVLIAERSSGKLEEAEGKLTGDEVLEAQGQAESTLGRAKQEKAEDLGTAAERKLDDVRDDDT